MNLGEWIAEVPDLRTEQARVRVHTGDPASGFVSGTFRIVPSRAASYSWLSINPAAPFAPRDVAGALVYQGKLWLLGGRNPGDKKHFPLVCNNEVWSSGDGKTWDLIKPNTFLNKSFDPASDWEGRHTAGYAVHRDKMWIIGGYANQGHYQNDVWSSTDGKTWTFVNKDKPLPWAPRALHYTVAHNDLLWVIGGQTMAAFAGAGEQFLPGYLDEPRWRSLDGSQAEGTVLAPAWHDRRQCRSQRQNLDSRRRHLRHSINPQSTIFQ